MADPAIAASTMAGIMPSKLAAPNVRALIGVTADPAVTSSPGIPVIRAATT